MTRANPSARASLWEVVPGTPTPEPAWATIRDIQTHLPFARVDSLTAAEIIVQALNQMAAPADMRSGVDEMRGTMYDAALVMVRQLKARAEAAEAQLAALRGPSETLTPTEQQTLILALGFFCNTGAQPQCKNDHLDAARVLLDRLLGHHARVEIQLVAGPTLDAEREANATLQRTVNDQARRLVELQQRLDVARGEAM